MARSSTLNQNHLNDWLKFYKGAPEGYKPKALQAVLEADGIKMLAAVLQELKLEKSVDLVNDWSTGTSSSKDAPVGRAAGKVNDLHTGPMGEAGEKGERE